MNVMTTITENTYTETRDTQTMNTNEQEERELQQVGEEHQNIHIYNEDNMIPNIHSKQENDEHMNEETTQENQEELQDIQNQQDNDDMQRILDNEEKGDSIYTKHKNTTRFLYQNINSLRPPRLHKWKDTIKLFLELFCDIVGLNETCLNWNKLITRQQFQKTLSTQCRNSSISVSTMKETLKRDYLPGGTMVATTGKWNSKKCGQIRDKHEMGRWSGTSYQVTATKKLHFITGYRVCNDNGNNRITSLASFSQQKVLLIERGLEEVSPRTQFTIDIINLIKELRCNPEDYIILALDANNPNRNETEGIDKIMDECDLLDAYECIHHDHSEFPTQQNGSKRIDYMLCSQNLLQYIERIGYVRFNEALDSDHRAIFWDVSDDILENKCNY
jgi:hypothetical protein